MDGMTNPGLFKMRRLKPGKKPWSQGWLHLLASVVHQWTNLRLGVRKGYWDREETMALGLVAEW